MATRKRKRVATKKKKVTRKKKVARAATKRKKTGRKKKTYKRLKEELKAAKTRIRTLLIRAREAEDRERRKERHGERMQAGLEKMHAIMSEGLKLKPGNPRRQYLLWKAQILGRTLELTGNQQDRLRRARTGGAKRFFEVAKALGFNPREAYTMFFSPDTTEV